MRISIDHGNRLMKTRRSLFTPGIEEHLKQPGNENFIYFNNKYYTLSENRIPYMRDKSEDNRFYHLTLFALAREIEAQGIEPREVNEITLLTGLPPSHFGEQVDNFEKYFLQNNGEVEFVHNTAEYRFLIKNVFTYPQGYAAAYTRYDLIKKYPKVVVVDIGGYTVDYIRMSYGKVDFTVVDSPEDGVITMYNDIQKKILSAYNTILTDLDIDNIIELHNTNDERILVSREIQEVVYNTASSFTYDILGKLRERKIDFASTLIVFVGGGSKLLKEIITASGKIPHCEFIKDIKANVLGNEILHDSLTA